MKKEESEKMSDKDLCMRMAVMMVLKERQEVGKSNEISIPKDYFIQRSNYFFNHLFNRTKSPEDLEQEFLSKLKTYKGG